MSWRWRVSEADIKEELAHFHRRKAVAAKEDGESSALEYLYSRLSILDAKVSSLLTVNSVLLAVIALAATESVRGSLPWLDLLAFGTNWVAAPIGALWLLSTGLCLWISVVRWDHIDEMPDRPEGDVEEYARRIMRVTVHRTALYNWAVAAIAGALASAIAPLLLGGLLADATRSGVAPQCDVAREVGEVMGAVGQAGPREALTTVQFKCGAREATVWLFVRESERQ